MTLLQKPIKHDTCAVRQCGEVTTLAPHCVCCSAGEEHQVKAFHLLTFVYFVSFVFEDLFAEDSSYKYGNPVSGGMNWQTRNLLP